MLTPSNLTHPSGSPQAQIVRSDPLPRWEQLPLEQQRELVMLLATLLVKRLPGHPLTREAVSDE
jgi:hypothetical protein